MPGACVDRPPLPPVLQLLSLGIHEMHGLGYMCRGAKWHRGAAGHQTQTVKVREGENSGSRLEFYKCGLT